MQIVDNYGDSRNWGFCIHCGRRPDSREHTPSRVLLDQPYPTNLHVAPACAECNASFSLDEEYVACLIECTIRGHVDPERVERPNVARLLRDKPALAARIAAARTTDGERTIFNVERERVDAVLLKLARGHVAYELNEPQLDDPSFVNHVPLPALTDEQRRSFEEPADVGLWPEVGSRAMQRVLGIGDPLERGWFVVQPRRYRFMTGTTGDSTFVRIVLSEYLAGEVVWAL